jgi:hypothetical protein
MEQEHEDEGIGLGVFLQLLKEAVGQILRLQNSDAFLSWMRAEAPGRFPEIFERLPDRVRRALATELGRQIWNVAPLPRNGYRPLRLPKPQEEDPCPCGSGRAYGRCCAGAPAVPGLTPELLWALVAGELPLDDAVALAEEGGIPRPYFGIIARRLMEEGRQARALALLAPLFDDLQLLDPRDADALDALLGAYETLGQSREMRSFIERFAEAFLRRSG